MVGRSGGGPHALACAALLPERVTKAAVLVGLAPHGADGLDWFDGMAQSNVLEFTAAANGYEDLAAHTKAVAEAVRADPASLIARLQAELPDPDRRVVADHGIRSMLLETYAEALRTSDYGWIDDALAFCSPWGFDPASVTVPVLLWHGASDIFSPASHARWLADRIPSAAVVVQAGAAHFGALDVLPDILRWLSAGRPDDRTLSHRRPSIMGQCGTRDRLARLGIGACWAVGAQICCGSRSRLIALPLRSCDGVRMACPEDPGRSRRGPAPGAPPPPGPALSRSVTARSAWQTRVSGMVAAQHLAQQRDGLALQRLGRGEDRPSRHGSWPG